MLPRDFGKMSAKEQERLGLPEGIKFFTPFPFDGMNQSDSRMGMEDKDLFYIENFIRLGNGNYRTLPDVGTALYTASVKTIISFFFYNIGSTNYVIIFFSDGTAVQVHSLTGAVTTVSAAANTFYNSAVSTQLPCCAQWGSQYLLIANNITNNSYWAWDGAVLYTAGTLSPQVTITNSGSNYSSPPSVVAFGGSGSGATFSATINNGSVVSILETNPGTGYQPGEQVLLEITGGGSDDGAELTAVISAGAVSNIILTNGGTGYTPGTYALSFAGGAGSGAAGAYTVLGGGTTVTAVAITAGGSGYTGAPTVSFPSGGGSGASAVATITPGTLQGATVVNGGTGFLGTPILTFVGGGGSGGAATANLTAGVITSVTITNNGGGYTSAPAVIVQSGLNKAASATVTLMPFGISGSSIETFESRVWIAFPNKVGTTQTGGVFNVSAPGSFSNFATSAGGLMFTSTDSFLRYQYTNMKQSNGYLYPMGDSSVSVISNVQTSINSINNFSSTTFNYQNTDPQIGTSWRDSCAAFSRTVLFGNPLGIYGLYGGAVTKVSSKIDQVFTNAAKASNPLLPSAAVANIYSKKIYAMLATFKDPFTLTQVNKMICWDEKDWFIASQSVNLVYIGTQEVDSTINAWGTDGKSLYQLFSSPSANLSKKLSTKLYGTSAAVIKKRSYLVLTQGQDMSSNQAGINLNVNIETNYSNPNTGAYAYPLPNQIAFAAVPPTYPFYSTWSGDVDGMNLGATVISTSPDFTFNFLGIGYFDETAEMGLPGG